MKKIAYLTVKTPLGAHEAFILTEMLALKKSGASLLIIPRGISTGVFHEKAKELLDDTLILPYINFKIIKELFSYIALRPLFTSKILFNTVFKARNVKIAVKNLCIIPKALYLSKILRQHNISNIHAHWASTTSTIAYIISKVTGIPWSFTAHRWDILENNILREKTKSASFVRAINENGRQEICEIINDDNLKKKISVIHMGVVLPELKSTPFNKPDIFKFLCPANLLIVKGHRYLFEACRILSDRGLQCKCLIAGDGPLEHELRRMAANLELDDCIEFLGRLPHERLFELYARREIHAVVLPSITTGDAEKEGIPVALMEAMSYGIPVISTNTGGIPELISDGSGIMVEEKNPAVIAGALEKLVKDQIYYNLLSEKGQEKIDCDFNVDKISTKLLALFSGEPQCSLPENSL